MISGHFKCRLLAGILVIAAVMPGFANAQALDEAAVTAQARAFGPPASDAASGNALSADDVRWLMDRLAIHDVLVRYTRGLDRHDELLIASAFWPDAQINYGDTFTGSRDAFVHWSIADDKQRFAAHTHNITNQTVDISGDVAHVESYLLGVEQKHDRSVQIVAGRYIDKMERRNGEWRIVLREFLLDTKGVADGSGFEPWKSCRSACGSMDHDDLSYKRPLLRRVGSDHQNQ